MRISHWEKIYDEKLNELSERNVSNCVPRYIPEFW